MRFFWRPALISTWRLFRNTFWFLFIWLLLIILREYFLNGRLAEEKKFFYTRVLSPTSEFCSFSNFFIDNIATVADMLNLNYSAPVLYFILPVGLSFHTFQSLSYVIEVYRGNQRAERNFITYAVYVMFFPQLVAGPIERPGHLLPQFKVFHRFDWER